MFIKDLDNNKFTKVLKQQMLEVNKYMKEQDDTDKEINISLLGGMGVTISEDRYENMLAEYALCNLEEDIKEDIVFWYIKWFKSFDTRYPKITVTDISWLQELFKLNNKKLKRTEVYEVLDWYYNVQGYSEEMVMSIAKDICKQNLS